LTSTPPENNDDDTTTLSNSNTLKKTYVAISLDLYRQFNNFMNSKYLKNEDAINKNHDKEIELIFNSGLVNVRKSFYSKDSQFLHNEKKARDDVLKNHGKIASEFLNCDSFPKIPINVFKVILDKVLENFQDRTVIEYRKTILDYCHMNEQAIQTLDVSFYVQLIPREYIDTATSSSSSEDDDSEEKK